MKRGPAGRRAGGAVSCRRFPKAHRPPRRLRAAAALASLVAPRLSEVLLDCGDVPVGGLRPH